MVTRQAPAQRAARTYLIHGLRVRSQTPVDAPRGRGARADIEISFGERRAVPASVPPGELLARQELPGGGSTLTADSDGYLWRVDGVCEFVADTARRNVLIHLAPDVEEEVASLFVGAFLAKLLALDGRCVLHASAVSVAGRVAAFIGPSGAGKTTVAALCCIAGAKLVSDDALRVELRDGEGWCYSGSRELRLRAGVAGLADRIPGGARRSTVDERTAVAPDAEAVRPFPLAAVVVPRYTEEADVLTVERVRGAAALRELLSAPRTVGWVSAERAQHELGVLAGLVDAVPVYHARLTWGREADPELGRGLLELIGLPPGVPLRSRQARASLAGAGGRAAAC